jgi:hypothetical protein
MARSIAVEGSAMTTTVYFATNRVVNGPADQLSSYTFDIVAPDDPQQVTYGTAYVDGSNLTADTVGAIRSIQDLQKSSFSDEAMGDLAGGGRNILVFIHGFANASRTPSRARPSIASGSPSPTWRPPTPPSSPSAGRHAAR